MKIYLKFKSGKIIIKKKEQLFVIEFLMRKQLKKKTQHKTKHYHMWITFPVNEKTILSFEWTINLYKMNKSSCVIVGKI